MAPSSLFRIGEYEYVHQNQRKNQGDCEMAISEGLSLDVSNVVVVVIIIIITCACSIQSHQVKQLHVFLGSICKNVYKFTDEELQQPGEHEADYWW